MITPSVIVTDCDLALIAAINKTFPHATKLLCAWHIVKNVITKVKGYFTTNEDFSKFLADWQALVTSIDREAFTTHGTTIKKSYDVAIIKYLQDIWLIYKERFVLAWTRDIMHFGHLITSRAEGKHSTIKSWISISTGDLKDVYEKISLAIEHQEHVIRQQLAYNRSTSLISHSHPIWANIKREISHFALRKTFEQFQKAKHLDNQAIPCSGVFKNTMGLPCAHILKILLAGINHSNEIILTSIGGS
jgi:histone-lysine N-methyltransferase SETD2